MIRLVVLVSVLLLGACTDDPSPATPSAAQPASSSSAPAPGWLASLPEGKPARVAYRVGPLLYVGDRATRLDTDDVDLVAGNRLVLVRERDGGRITAYRPRAGLVREVARTSGGSPVFLTGSDDYVLFPRSHTARVDWVELRVGDPRGQRLVDSQAFPVPSSEEFRLLGTTQFLEVFVDTADGPWVWSASEGQEGVAHDVPDSDAYVERFEAPYGARALFADGGDSVYFRDSSSYYRVASPEGEGRFPRGLRRFDTFREAEFSYTYALVRRRSGALDAVDLERYRTVRLPIPTAVESRFVSWEVRHVLVDVTDEAGARAIVRCQATTGTCARVQDLPSRAVLAAYR